MARKVGARGLRMILEELMLDLMYHLPSQKRVKDFEVTKEMVERRTCPCPPWKKRADPPPPIRRPVPKRNAQNGQVLQTKSSICLRYQWQSNLLVSLLT